MWMKTCFHSHFYTNYLESFLYPWFLINVKLRSSSFRLHQVVYDGPNAFFPNSTGPWPLLQKGKKIPAQAYLSPWWSPVQLVPNLYSLVHLLCDSKKSHVFQSLSYTNPKTYGC